MSEMTHKERFLRTLNYEPVDRRAWRWLDKVLKNGLEPAIRKGEGLSW